MGNSFIKNDIIHFDVYINLPFIYKNPIISSLLKIITLKFTTYILTILIYPLKIDFYYPDFFWDLTFNKQFFHNKRL